MTRTIVRTGGAQAVHADAPERHVVHAGSDQGAAVVSGKGRTSSLVHTTSDSEVAVSEKPERILVRAHAPQSGVVLAGTRGRQGPRGEPGPAGGSAFIRIAGESISALQVLYELPTGRVHPLSPDDMNHIDLLAGVALTAGSVGDDIAVQRSGVLDATGLGMAPGRVWLGEDGRMTQSPPEEGFDVLLGYATAEQRMYIDISEPIQLED